MLWALAGPLEIGAFAFVRLSALIRWSASGSRSGAVGVPQTAGFTAEPVRARRAMPVGDVVGREAPTDASAPALLDGPLTTESGATARTAGLRRRLAFSAAVTLVATAFSVR